MNWYKRAIVVISIVLAVGPMLACAGDSFCSAGNDGSRQSVAECN